MLEIYSKFQLLYYQVEKSKAKSAIKLVERKHWQNENKRFLNPIFLKSILFSF